MYISDEPRFKGLKSQKKSLLSILARTFCLAIPPRCLQRCHFESRPIAFNFFREMLEHRLRCWSTTRMRGLSPLGAYHLGRGGWCPGTCHIPTLVGDMAGKRGASQGSPLRMAPGFHWVWEGTPSLVQSDTVNRHPSRARCRTPRTPHHRVRLHDPGAAMETPADAGVDTAHSLWLRSWWSPSKKPPH